MNSEPRQPAFAESPHDDPRTVSEMADNSLTDIFIQAEAGVISWVEAKERMDQIEAMRAEVGLFEGDQR